MSKEYMNRQSKPLVNPAIVGLPSSGFILFSPELSTNTTEQNLLARGRLIGLLEDAGVQFRECEGSYKGVKEFSYKVDLEHLSEASRLAFAVFAQESILIVKDRQGTLVYSNGTTEPLQGVWGAIEWNSEPMAYTIDNGIKYSFIKE